jgi:hypothetical protein
VRRWYGEEQGDCGRFFSLLLVNIQPDEHITGRPGDFLVSLAGTDDRGLSAFAPPEVFGQVNFDRQNVLFNFGFHVQHDFSPFSFKLWPYMAGFCDNTLQDIARLLFSVDTAMMLYPAIYYLICHLTLFLYTTRPKTLPTLRVGNEYGLKFAIQ